VSPGRSAYERVRKDAQLEREWDELSPDERDTWERGASMRPVGATIDFRQDSNIKVA